MTNQPNGEALRLKIEAALDAADGDLVGEIGFAKHTDAILSILSTALAERDERIAELEGALKPFAVEFQEQIPDDAVTLVFHSFDRQHGTGIKVADYALARAKLKESSRG